MGSITAEVIEKIVDEELSRGDPRSPEYRLGMLDVLRFKMNGTLIPKRYAQGTAQADAYFSGNERGHFFWRTNEAKIKGTPSAQR